MAVGEFSGDGRSNLAVVNNSSSKVTVCWETARDGSLRLLLARMPSALLQFPWW
jgi:hypothetical protein